MKLAVYIQFLDNVLFLARILHFFIVCQKTETKIDLYHYLLIVRFKSRVVVFLLVLVRFDSLAVIDSTSAYTVGKHSHTHRKSVRSQD